MFLRIVFSWFLLLLFTNTHAQTDTIISVPDSLIKESPIQAEKIVVVTTDTTKKKWSPAKTAAIYSAILPSAGQAYNRKYWKMPLVWGALAVPGYFFVDNLTEFRRARYAYNYLYDRINPPVNLADTFGIYSAIHATFRATVDRGDLPRIQNYRNQVRQNVDYSALFFILLWGLNVVDAAVDGHLKDFNVTDDLSIQIKPGRMPIGNTTGIGIVFNIGKNHVHRN